MTDLYSSVLFVFCFFLIYNCVADNLIETTPSVCNSHGWYNLRLLCTTCTQIDLGDKVTDYCKRCCKESTLLSKNVLSVSEKKYSRAILEFCYCKATLYPEITTFINGKEPLKFTNLEIKEVGGVNPTIKLLNQHGNVEYQEEIETWNSDDIVHFLTKHLENKTKDVIYDNLKDLKF